MRNEYCPSTVWCELAGDEPFATRKVELSTAGKPTRNGALANGIETKRMFEHQEFSHLQHKGLAPPCFLGLLHPSGSLFQVKKSPMLGSCDPKGVRGELDEPFVDSVFEDLVHPLKIIW